MRPSSRANRTRRLLLLAALAAFTPAISHGITLPVSEDAYAALIKQGNAPRITAATGTAATLRLSTAATPVIRFEAGSLAADYPWLRVRSVRPGYTETRMLAAFDERFLAQQRAKTPFQTPQDVAAQILTEVNRK